jgi:hypothetical protein
MTKPPGLLWRVVVFAGRRKAKRRYGFVAGTGQSGYCVGDSVFAKSVTAGYAKTAF